MNDSDRHRLIRESWDENATLWTEAIRKARIPSRIEGTNRAVIEAVHATGGRRILDVGCGEGWLSHLLAEEGRDVTGFDGSGGLIAAAKRGSGRFLHLDYRAFIANPQAVGGNFDAAVCNFSLFEQHLDQLMSAIATRLVPAGHLVIQTVHPIAAIGDASYEDGWRTEGFQSLGEDFHEMPWYFRTLGSWVDLLGRSGFRLVRCGEPLSEATGLPLSLVLSCQSRQ